MALLLVVQWWMRDLTGKPGSTFPNRAAQILEYWRLMTLLRIVIQLDVFRLSMILSETGSHFALRGRTGPDHAPGALSPKKEARPKGPGTPYALRRNIFRKRQKTMVCLAFG